MSNEILKAFVEEQLNIAAKKIIDKGDKTDEISSGKIDFFYCVTECLVW